MLFHYTHTPHMKKNMAAAIMSEWESKIYFILRNSVKRFEWRLIIDQWCGFRFSKFIKMAEQKPVIRLFELCDSSKLWDLRLLAHSISTTANHKGLLRKRKLNFPASYNREISKIQDLILIHWLQLIDRFLFNFVQTFCLDGKFIQIRNYVVEQQINVYKYLSHRTKSAKFCLRQ